MSRAEDPLARAERITAELRAATSAAAGMLKSLEAASKLARRQVDGYLGRGVTDVVNARNATLQEEIHAFAKAARADVEKYVAEAVERAQDALERAATIEYLCRVVATIVASATEYTDEGPVVDLSRSLDWVWIDKQLEP